jgi:hypothetical protein
MIDCNPERLQQWLPHGWLVPLRFGAPGMKFMIKTFVTLGLALVLLNGTPAETAGRTYCKSTVAEKLADLNVGSSDVSNISYDPQREAGGDNDRIVRVLAWVSLRSCRGHLVIDMSRHCAVRQVYGRGECKVPVE